MKIQRLDKISVEKPWGVEGIPAHFSPSSSERIGEIWYDIAQEHLPLMIKWLFTSEKLSVQVHPSDHQAKARGLQSGKEECWFVVDAKEGGVLGIGTQVPMTPEELRASALDGSIEDKMVWHPVKQGDWFHIPPGTIHAIGAGVTLVEVQQNADVTYRLYDYGRPRALHLDDGVAVADAIPYAAVHHGHYSKAFGPAQILETAYFSLYAITGTASWTPPVARNAWITPIMGKVVADGVGAGVGDCLYGRCDDIELRDGASALVAFAK